MRAHGLGGAAGIARLDALEDALMGGDRIFRRMASELVAAQGEMKGVAQRSGHGLQEMAQHPVAAGERHGLMEADIALMIALLRRGPVAAAHLRRRRPHAGQGAGDGRGPGARDPLGAKRGRLDLERLAHLDKVEQALGVMAHGRGQKIAEGGAVGLAHDGAAPAGEVEKPAAGEHLHRLAHRQPADVIGGGELGFARELRAGRQLAQDEIHQPRDDTVDGGKGGAGDGRARHHGNQKLSDRFERVNVTSARGRAPDCRHYPAIWPIDNRNGA